MKDWISVIRRAIIGKIIKQNPSVIRRGFMLRVILPDA